MGWMSRFRTSGEAEPAGPWDEARGETVINGVPLAAHKTTRSSPEKTAAPGDRPDAQIPEEIKRRQTMLVARYVAAMRAR